MLFKKTQNRDTDSSRKSTLLDAVTLAARLAICLIAADALINSVSEPKIDPAPLKISARQNVQTIPSVEQPVLKPSPASNVIQFLQFPNSDVFMAEARANQEDSMRILRENGLRPLTYQEAILKLDSNPELKEILKGKGFFLSGDETIPTGRYIFNNQGELAEGAGEPDQTVSVWAGGETGVSSIVIYPDSAVNMIGFRFFLGPGYFEYKDYKDAAPLIIGVKQ